jgi:peptidoglycan/xylan/chitin deacetylase (PgdA/CDA1 family)
MPKIARAALAHIAAFAVALGVGWRTARAEGALPSIAPNGRAPYVAVLVWHDVLPQKEVWFDTTTATFAQQLDEIARGGFVVIPLSALRDHLTRGRPIPAKSLVLTFDDNGAGIYANAFPLLRRHRFPATLFVHTNFVGKTTSKHHNTWDELRAMERTGSIDVESQTANHPPDLTKLSDADVRHEFLLSAFSLERRLGRRAYAVVYPYDVYDLRVERLAAESGYTLGFTEDWGAAGDSSSLLEIHRYSILTRFDQALADVAAHARNVAPR